MLVAARSASSTRLRPLHHHRFHRLVLPDAFKGRMPENAITGPVRVLDLDHHQGLDPIDATAILPRHHDERRIVAAMLPQLGHQLAPDLEAKARTHPAGEYELAILVVAHEEGPELALRRLRFHPAANHEFLP